LVSNVVPRLIQRQRLEKGFKVGIQCCTNIGTTSEVVTPEHPPLMKQFLYEKYTVLHNYPYL
jgi:hypothetical protein